MEYYYLDDAIYVDKKDGTKVHYFIFDEFEIHYNSIAPLSEDGILIGTVAMIMVMLCWKTAKSVNI